MVNLKWVTDGVSRSYRNVPVFLMLNNDLHGVLWVSKVTFKAILYFFHGRPTHWTATVDLELPAENEDGAAQTEVRTLDLGTFTVEDPRTAIVFAKGRVATLQFLVHEHGTGRSVFIELPPRRRFTF